MHYKYAAGKSKSDVEHEKELIRRVQQYDDKLAMKELISGYQGLLHKCVMDSGVTMSGSNIDPLTAMNYAERYAKRYIKTYDASMGTQPSTYLVNNVTKQLKNIKSEFEEGVSHMSNALSEDGRYVRKAEEWLRDMGVEPTAANIHHFVKTEFQKGRAKTGVNTVERIKAMQRREYSGSRVLGNNDEGGDVITLSELAASQGGPTGEERFNDFQKQQKIRQAINSPEFSHAERNYICHLAGIGQYEGNPTNNKNLAAMDAGLTYAQGINAIKKLQAKLKEL